MFRFEEEGILVHKFGERESKKKKKIIIINGKRQGVELDNGQ